MHCTSASACSVQLTTNRNIKNSEEYKVTEQELILENEAVPPDSKSVLDEDTTAISGNSNYSEGQDKI
jgi:hypothetical protein